MAGAVPDPATPAAPSSPAAPATPANPPTTTPSHDPEDPSLLRNQIAAHDGSITIVAAAGCAAVLDWSFGPKGMGAQVILKTPLGSLPLCSTALEEGNPALHFGGSAHGFEAEGDVALDFHTRILTLSGEVRAFGETKQGSTAIHL